MAGMPIAEALRLAHDEEAVDVDPLAVRDALVLLAGVVEKVRQIHSPQDVRGPYAECGSCGQDGQENPIGWPCDTADAVGTEPRVETTVTVRWDG